MVGRRDSTESVCHVRGGGSKTHPPPGSACPDQLDAAPTTWRP